MLFIHSSANGHLGYFHLLTTVNNAAMNMCLLSRFSCVSLIVSLWTVAHRLLYSWDSPGKNTGLGCHALLQGIFPTQGLYPCFWHWRHILYHWAMREAPDGGLLKPLEVVEIDSCAWMSTFKNEELKETAVCVFLTCCLWKACHYRLCQVKLMLFQSL